MKKKNKKIMSVSFVLLIIIIGAVFFYFFNKISASMWYSGLPHCIIPASGGECQINITLPEERAATTYFLNLDFDYVLANDFSEKFDISGQYSDYKVLDTYIIRSDYDEIGRYFIYLYKLPITFPENIKELKIEAITTGSCNSGRNQDSKINLQTFLYNIPSNLNNIEVCLNSDSLKCPANDIRPYIKHYYNSYGERKISFKDMNSIQSTSVRCMSETQINNRILINERNVIPLVENRDEIRFLINLYTLSEGGATASIVHPVQFLFVSYREAEYPNNLEYSFGNFKDKLIGISNQEKNTLDFAQQINNYCNRTKNSNECAVPLNFVSENKGGVVVIKETNSILKINEIEDENGNNNDDGDEEKKSYFWHIVATTIIFIVLLAVFVVLNNKK